MKRYVRNGLLYEDDGELLRWESLEDFVVDGICYRFRDDDHHSRSMIELLPDVPHSAVAGRWFAEPLPEALLDDWVWTGHGL